MLSSLLEVNDSCNGGDGHEKKEFVMGKYFGIVCAHERLHKEDIKLEIMEERNGRSRMKKVINNTKNFD